MLDLLAPRGNPDPLPNGKRAGRFDLHRASYDRMVSVLGNPCSACPGPPAADTTNMTSANTANRRADTASHPRAPAITRHAVTGIKALVVVRMVGAPPL